jgi:hypothetical protein
MQPGTSRRSSGRKEQEINRITANLDEARHLEERLR